MIKYPIFYHVIDDLMLNRYWNNYLIAFRVREKLEKIHVSFITLTLAINGCGNYRL